MLDFNGIKVVSYFPGRIRLRVDKLKHDPGFAAAVQEKLQDVPGIKKLEVKESTGSILVVYDKKTLVQPAASKQLLARLHKLFPEADTDRIKALLAG
jgi:hypothetical protein